MGSVSRSWVAGPYTLMSVHFTQYSTESIIERARVLSLMEPTSHGVTYPLRMG